MTMARTRAATSVPIRKFGSRLRDAWSSLAPGGGPAHTRRTCGPAGGRQTRAGARRLPSKLRIGTLDLQQKDGVRHERDGEADGPAVEVALHQRAARGAAGRPDAERARHPSVFPRVQQDEEDQDDRDEDLHDGEDRMHPRLSVLRAQLVKAPQDLARPPAQPAVEAPPVLLGQLAGPEVELGVADLAVLRVARGLELG